MQSADAAERMDGTPVSHFRFIYILRALVFEAWLLLGGIVMGQGASVSIVQPGPTTLVQFPPGTNLGTTSALPAPGNNAQPSRLQDMEQAGRVYQNPRHCAELWINIGSGTPGSQLWMPYQPWFSPYISQQHYDGLVARLQREFVDPPIKSTALSVVAGVLCCCTCGICSCPLCYIKKQVSDFNLKLDAAVDEVVRGLGINTCEVKVKMTQVQKPSQGWLDSKGCQLMGTFSSGSGEDSHTYQAPAGPPNGYNLVLIGPMMEYQGSMVRGALPWPPTSAITSMVAPVQAVPAVAMPGMVPPDIDRGPEHVDVADELRKLNDLHQQGILTDDEFADAKAKVISQP